MAFLKGKRANFYSWLKSIRPSRLHLQFTVGTNSFHFSYFSVQSSLSLASCHQSLMLDKMLSFEIKRCSTSNDIIWKMQRDE